MSNMRIKKHKGVKLTDTRHPPPKKNREGDDEEEKLLQCIMCNCMTIEEYLKRHIRYNHLISKDEIIDKLYNLHYPPQQVSVYTQTTSVTSAPEPNKRDDFDRHKKPILKNRIKTEKIVEADDEEVLCPACGDVEDGTPMVACGVCDSWYHWVCVGLHTKPAKGTEWLCTSCSGKAGSSKGKRTNVPEAGARRMSSPEDEPSSSKGIPARQKVHAQKHYSSDEDDDDPHDDLRYSDDSLQDKDFEPQESDYDEQDMNLIPERKFTSGEREQKKKKKIRMSNPPTEDDYDDMSRDDLRKLCHKEMINA